MDINDKFVKFSGKEELIPSIELQLGQDVEFTVKGTVVKVEETDTQEGTKDVTYVVKVTQVE